MKNKKLYILIGLLAVVGIGAYFYFTSSDKAATTPTTNTLVSSNTGSSPVTLNETSSVSSFAGSDIAGLLKNIDQIKLNTAILSNPAFNALVDTTLTLPETNVSGRINPFGSSGALITPTTSTQINNTQTTQTVSPTTNTNSLPK